MSHLSDFSALLFDVDGTLANYDYHITPQIQTALKNLQTAGLITGVCTGRHFAQMGEYILGNFPTDSLHVVSGGAQVIDKQGNVLWQQSIPGELCAETIASIKAHDLSFLTHSGAYSYASKDVREWFRPSLPGVHPVQPLEDLPAAELPILVVFQPTPHFLAFLDNQPNLSYKMLDSKKHGSYIDITAKNVTKAAGLAEWSKMTNVPLEKVIGFGDSNNDLEFLQAVGWPVGMGNSTAEVKAIVRSLIGHVDQNGLPEYLQKILAGAPL